METIINNEAIAEILNQQTEEATPLEKEIDACKTFTDLKEVAKKYPKVFDIKGYKSFSSLYEYMMDIASADEVITETTPKANVSQGNKAPKPPKPPKPPKEKKERVASAFGTAIETLCREPELKYKDLLAECKKAGFSNPNAIRTAHAQFGKIYKLLTANGFVK